MKEMIPLRRCPVGMFVSKRGELCVKTEYGLKSIIVATGEIFWGGAKTLEELNQVKVRPVEVEIVRHAQWIPVELERSFGILKGVKCSLCGEEKVGKIGNYCPKCGAKMDAQPEPSRGCATCANDGMDMPQCRECVEQPGYPWYRPKDGGAEDDA